MVIGIFAGCNKKEDLTPADTSVKKEATEKPDPTVEPTVAPTKIEETNQTTVPELEGYTLLWNDEFEGDSLNTDTWNYEPREPGWTNNELQEYTTSTDNVFVEDGRLIIKAIKTTDAAGNDYYTSGKVTTQNKQDFTYGKVVVSAKVPRGQGLWPAIWMMPKVQEFYGEWPKCGEIDIMEVLGHQVDTAHGTIHYGEPHAQQQGTYVLEEGTFADDFHEFSVEWEPGEFRFYIDGNHYKTVNDWFTAVEGEEEKPYPAPFNQPFFVQLNLAVGGNWPGNPDETTDFDNALFEVDYVRVYQKPEYDLNVQKPVTILVEPEAGANYIRNGDFSNAEDLTDDIDWKFLLAQNGEGSAEIKDGMITILSQNAGAVDYSVQLVQPNLAMKKGSKYQVTFDAYASEERDIIVCVSAPDNGWIRYLPDTLLTLSTSMQTYTYTFDMTGKDDPNGRLEFNLGNRGSIADVHITNVRVEKIQ
ncbi:family 16 glycosylhydrolase [Mobilitalea sibirica]|uniref:Family 16 glycosylhydrolase n=2 Tax=Mobilitalea sibirica TaxID=1462919 RepID=A0A8J7KW84_9FIRM|nr:family 16 glycosylhydrolase [Mobilitalea sibirica]